MVFKKDFKQAVILAGGLGTRLRPITNTIPKPMIQFHGLPFLEYLILMLKENNFNEIVLLLGYLPEKVVDYFGDGSKWGVKIIYSISEVEDDTGLRLKKAQHLINKYFMLLYCDNYWPIRFDEMFEKFLLNNVDALVTVYNNKDNYTKNNLKINNEGFIEIYDKDRKAENLQGVDIGFYLLNKKVLDLIPDGNHNFERTVLPILIKNKKIITYCTDHRYYSVGSHERLILTEQFLKNEKFIFLDRDGVLNVKASKSNYITKWENWKWIDGSLDALNILTKNGYKIIIITNQAGIARGMMSINDLEDIHYKMVLDIKNYGGNIEKIYYCPHSWNANCFCRKPMPGMLIQAQNDYNLNLTNTYFIGDDERDGLAAISAGTKYIQVDEVNNLLSYVNNIIVH